MAAGVGIGHYTVETTAGASLARPAAGINAGGGVILVHRDDVWFRADLRYLRHEDQVPAAWRLVIALTFYRSS